eukprot:CAMPEP_0194227698 /NCGR_PEP_ID=MMETSP0156-20130528/42992_1 /TAXON_ID=33649 /ORGANISM="Thalassionema nitzschioides, Strain L26-B" /LENGTH=1107 /DNA_ID=CAMNT_0038960191 /DNA_START=38 /DNA_END=3361 /DNA_ORIENTATION=-
MAEELDDLFGAFDDADDDDNNDNNNDDDEKKNEETTKVLENNDADSSSSNNNKLVYTSIMSKPTASKVTTTTTKEENDDDEAKEEEDKVISTGTSHDKTVRSYSSYPKQNLPPDMQPPKVIPPTQPSKTYPFELDPFQKQAIQYIDLEESVLVAAHTSAGKTAVAEYAVAKSLKAGQRVVYTSPIKALSNQKFRDLQEEFSDVGLMTGDITINPTATALVMTTEILRSMLYRGSELMREVAWVIYDEVHYMRDSERGVVWEESIILLPHKVRFVFLSATIPNASQFADWITAIHHQACHVVYTNYRPVPLQHYIFPQGGEGLHLVVDERGKFREANFQRAMAALGSSSVDEAAATNMLSSGNGKRKRKRSSSGKGGKGGTSDLYNIVQLIMTRNLNPVIIFSFSKKDCEKYALDLHREDYTDDVEKDLIAQVYTNAIESLSDDDRTLPQVVALLPLLKRGIGIHHGGLLPILKEIVEILFSEGLIKCLFATETFSIGINMPAKTVVFTNTRKWDGKDFRWVTSGEYIQMSGRAGRRGKDDRGIVIQMVDEKMEPAVCKGILYGDPDPLNSSYKISYNMLLNMMRVEDVDPEYLLRSSFHQFQREKEVPGLLLQAKEMEEKAAQIEIEDAELVSTYYQMDQQLVVTRNKLMAICRQPQYILKFLQRSGRFLDITIDGDSYGWGALVSCNNTNSSGVGGNSGGAAGKLAQAAKKQQTYTLDVLLFCVDRHFDKKKDDDDVQKEDVQNQSMLWRGSHEHCRPVRQEEENGGDSKLISMRLFTISLDCVDRISAVVLYVPKDVHPPEARKNVGIAVKEVQKRFPDGVPLLDPIKDLCVKDPEYQLLLARATELTTRMAHHIESHKDSSSSVLADEDERTKQIQLYQRKEEYLKGAKLIRAEAHSYETIVMKDTMKQMKRVLKKLGHVDAHGVIQTKGRTACEINTADELLVVELMFTGIFADLTSEQCVALLSVLTFDERNKKDENDDPLKGLKGYLTIPYIKLQDVARSVCHAIQACKIELDEDEYVEKFNPGMMEAVFAWSKGAKFVDVQKLTDTFEGSTIRTLRRLEELVRQIANASKAIGNAELQAKMEKGSELLKRDIVFCSSLYL